MKLQHKDIPLHVSGKVLLLTSAFDGFPAGGRQLLCKINYEVLKQIFGDQCFLFEMHIDKIRDTKSIINAFDGKIDGINDKAIDETLKQINAENIDKVFVDGSNYGELARAVKIRFPEVRIYTFFHNVEARFFWGALKQTKTPHALGVFLTNYLAERKAVRFSDEIICLNKRDSNLLQRVYSRSATHLSAIALQDQFPSITDLSTACRHEKFALFVGGVFYANYAGISWFIKNVIPRIHIKIYIVGRGFEKFKSELEVSEKVVVVGEVDSLAQWYFDSLFVIAPIFDGSGMKTKVAEALMFGKRVVGTPEAFSGYEDVVAHVGRVCVTVDDFVTAIRHEVQRNNKAFDPDLRKLYENKYSFQAAKLRLAGILRSENKC